MGIKMLNIFKLQIRKLCAFFCGLVVILLVIPLLFLLLIPFIIYRRILFNSAKCLRPDLGKMLNAGGTLAAFENVYKSPRMKIVSGWVVEGCPTKQEIFDGMKSTIETIDNQTGDILYPELTQSLENWMGYRFWKPVRNFDLKDYVEYVDNQENPLSYTDAENLLYKETLVPFEYNKALWKLVVFTNYNPEGSKISTKPGSQYSYLLFCIHHCLADGFSILKLIHRIFQTPYNQQNRSNNSKPKGFCRRVFKCFSLFVRVPCDLGELVFDQTLQKPFWVDNKVNSGENSVGCKIPENIHPFKASFSELFPFERIREIKKQHGVTSISVIVAGIAGSIRSTMFKNALTIPKRIPFGFPIPLPNHPEKLRNHTTAIVMTLPVGEADPLKRLHDINQSILNMKRSTLPYIFPWLTVMVGSLPPALLKIQANVVSQKPTGVVSSLALSNEELVGFGKYTLKDLKWGSSVASGTKMFTSTFTTYAGNGRFGVGADSSVICSEEHATEIINGFVNELNAMNNVVCKTDFASENV